MVPNFPRNTGRVSACVSTADSVFSVEVGGNETQFTLSELEPNQLYRVRIAAGTGIGFGVPSDWVQHQTLARYDHSDHSICKIWRLFLFFSLNISHLSASPLNKYTETQTQVPQLYVVSSPDWRSDWVHGLHGSSVTPCFSSSDLCPNRAESPSAHEHAQRDVAAVTQSHPGVWVQALLPGGGCC